MEINSVNHLQLDPSTVQAQDFRKGTLFLHGLLLVLKTAKYAKLEIFLIVKVSVQQNFMFSEAEKGFLILTSSITCHGWSDVRDFAEANLHGTSGRQRVPCESFDSLFLNLPDYNKQRAIAGVLSSLDDKIDLLHRQNKTLEGMGEAIWRQMFVEDADPGWKKGKLGDIVSVSTGKGLKRIEYNENGLYPVIGANGEIGRTDKYLTNEKLILTGRVGTLGEIFISNREVWISDNVLMIKPNEDRVFHAVYFLLKNMDFENLNVGSTQPLVTQTDLKNIEIELPDNDILDYFATWCESAFNKIEQNDSQISTLSKMRNTLLPKLMSGEIPVKDAERFVCEV